MAKANDFLEHLIDNPARAKILRLFILHPKETFTPVEVARRAKVGPNSVNAEVASLHKIGFLKEEKGEGSSARKRVSYYSVDPNFKHLNALSTFIHEVSPTQYTEVERALRRTGRLTAVVLSGVFTGDLTRPADIIIVGDYLNEERLEKAVKSFEPQFGREIRYVVLSTPEFRYRLTIKDRIIRDTLDYPHRILINRNNLI
ncbi:hypothetical protein A2765_02880 [Candidatus Kaiserbacteria bacterium RIFCSPHIGHO2_01_FULL_56_24]|uniref:HTH arsR-type domain-containing protein n=1 Tax=Candidatus Kaiserbacteria bacterium RIFCSPHIGHO2_01_FULL_56_24 TaxID=1798487 RepID=A0A1F6DB32_9BACT|nr:MAG: hypothetical protein A2765_02880 [Candidatus Kaiserbacteria bacterium RIFCSPHIGHO2_01_FULL_56_24]